MRYRVFTEDDFEALSALDLTVQRHLDADFDALPEREREGRLRTSLASLRFYLRSEHSFVADEAGQLLGLMLAQSVWMGDRPIILVTACLLHPALNDRGSGTAAALLHAVIKSAYDAAVYEIHYAVTAALQQAAEGRGQPRAWPLRRASPGQPPADRAGRALHGRRLHRRGPHVLRSRGGPEDGSVTPRQRRRR